MRIYELIFGIALLILTVVIFIKGWPSAFGTTTFLIGAIFTLIGWVGDNDDK